MRFRSFFFCLLLSFALASCQAEAPQPLVVNDVDEAPPAASMPEPSGSDASERSLRAALSQDDLIEEQRAEARAYTAPIGQKVTWRNPRSGHAGVIVPLRDSYAESGAYCRVFQKSVTLSGRSQTFVMRACQDVDGVWTFLP